MRRRVIGLIITVVAIVGMFVAHAPLGQPARARARPPGRHLDRALPGEGLRPQRPQHRGRRDPEPGRRSRHRRARRAASRQHDRRRTCRASKTGRRPRAWWARRPSCGSGRCSTTAGQPLDLPVRHAGHDDDLAQGRHDDHGQGRDRHDRPHGRAEPSSSTTAAPSTTGHAAARAGRTIDTLPIVARWPRPHAATTAVTTAAGSLSAGSGSRDGVGRLGRRAHDGRGHHPHNDPHHEHHRSPGRSPVAKRSSRRARRIPTPRRRSCCPTVSVSTATCSVRRS